VIVWDLCKAVVVQLNVVISVTRQSNWYKWGNPCSRFIHDLQIFFTRYI
jgi:hypothetical protein